MKFVVLGAGAMGCLYGAKLYKNGENVTFIDVNMPHIEKINKDGLLVHWASGDEFLKIPAMLAADYHDVADVLIVFTKSVFSEAALDSVRGAIGPETLLISFQNGLGHDDIMRKYAVDDDHIIIGTTNFPSDLLGYGEFANHGTGVTRMMTASGTVNDRITELNDIFERSGLNPELTSDVFSAIWEKVAFNSALNSLTSATLLPQGYLGQTKEGKILAHDIVREVCMVAKTKGIKVNEEHVHETVDNLFSNHFDHCPSMLQDVMNHRMTEIEYINGAVVHEAEKLGLAVPVTRVLYYLVSIYQQTYPNRIDGHK